MGRNHVPKSLNKKFLVSIVTPVFNNLKYLKSSFSSVRHQNIGFENIEYVLVDDCSDDGGYEWLSVMAAKYSNVKLYRTSVNSGGAGIPRNIALDAVASDYIIFLDSDDMLSRNAVSYLYDRISKGNADIVNGTFYELGGNGGIRLDTRYINKREGIYDFRGDSKEWFPIVHPIFTKIFRTEIIQRNSIRFDSKLRNGEDSLFLFEYMKCTRDALHENKPICKYRVRGGSLSHKYDKHYFIRMTQLYKKTEDLLRETEFFDYYRMFVEAGMSAHMDILCDCNNFSNDDYIEILSSWFSILKYVGENNLKTDSAIGTILADDAKKDDFEAVKFHFFAMRPMYELRRAQIEDFMNSKTIRLALMFQGIWTRTLRLFTSV